MKESRGNSGGRSAEQPMQQEIQDYTVKQISVSKQATERCFKILELMSFCRLVLQRWRDSDGEEAVTTCAILSLCFFIVRFLNLYMKKSYS